MCYLNSKKSSRILNFKSTKNAKLPTNFELKDIYKMMVSFWFSYFKNEVQTSHSCTKFYELLYKVHTINEIKMPLFIKGPPAVNFSTLS